MATAMLLNAKVRTGPKPTAEEQEGLVKTRTGRVEVIHGIYAHSLPLAGKSVWQAREELEERMNIAAEAVAVLDGVEATDDAVLIEGQVLSFITPAGEKG